MSRIGSFLIRASFVSALLTIAYFSASAQMTIFNIPTTDTLQRKSFFLELDLITKPVRNRDGGYRTYGYRSVYGLGHKTEVGANFFYTRGADGSTGELQFNAKRSLYRNEKRGVAVSGGTLVFIPLRNSSPLRAGVMGYANASKMIDRFRGLRLTGGVYTVLRGGSDFGTRNGVMLGVEQPLTKRFSFLGDWYSGKNRFGYAAAGLNYNITTRQFILAGYNFGNSGRGNNAFSAFYGYTF